MGKLIFIIIFLLLQLVSRSQADFSPKTWQHIDTSITAGKNLRDIHDLVRDLQSKAVQQKKHFHTARTWYYQLRMTDRLTEDSFYFRNSFFIDSLLMTPGLPKELQLSLHLLMGKRLAMFTGKYLRFNRQRYEWAKLPVNYASFSNVQLDSMALHHLNNALALAKDIPGYVLEEALWLSSDPLLFLYKPGLYDIVMAERIHITSGGSMAPYSIQLKHSDWIVLHPDEFISKLDSLSLSGGKEYNKLKFYAEWMAYHKGDKSVYYFIETLARKYLAGSVPGNDDLSFRPYEKYLIQITGSPFPLVRAHGVYQLCLMWNQQAKKYFPVTDGNYGYSNYRQRGNDYDTAYRLHALKALQLFDQNRALLDSFAYLRNILQKMENQIRESETNMIIQQYNLPGELLLAELIYKNAATLHYRIVRAGHSHTINYRSREELIQKLMQLSTVKEQVVALPETGDFNKHALYLKLDALPAGSYYILFSHQPLTDSNRNIERLNFRVSSIATIDNRRRVYVLDRKTGMPLAGATVVGKYVQNSRDTTVKQKDIIKNFTVNAQGFVTITDEKIKTIDVFYKADSAHFTVNIDGGNADEPEDVYSKDEYDDLVEFYEDNATAYIYTDRSIYRPGQTVYFKAIFLTKDKRTGEPVVMSPKSMGQSLFRKVYKKWLKESEPFLFLNDPFGKEIDSVKIKPDEYGSVSGSFKLPKTAATGEWDIEPDYIDKEWRTGSFRVEEYKRPSYEISIEKPEKELLPGDSVVFKVKVKSFAGAQLNNVLIRYTVSRSGDLPEENSLIPRPGKNYQNVDLLDTTGYTNENGELEIAIADTALKQYTLEGETNWTYRYWLEAEAVDQTGESYKEEASVTVMSRPVTVLFPSTDKYDRSTSNNLAIATRDNNAGSVSKKISIKIFRLEENDKLYNERKLLKADKWLYPRQDLQMWFPSVNFEQSKEETKRHFITEVSLMTGTNEKLKLDPALLTAGEYVMEAVCEENGRILGKNEKRFSVFDQKERSLPGKTYVFYHLPNDNTSPGDTIHFYSGNSETTTYAIKQVKYYTTGKKTRVKDVYDSGLLPAGLQLWRWKVPADATGQMVLSTTYVLNNEVFTHEEKIYISRRDVVEPEIIVEKYRKKLAPGSKETFMVSIKTNNNKIAAELMTTMYDASLDKLEPHKWEIPREERSRYLHVNWTGDINSNSENYGYGADMYVYSDTAKAVNEQPLWWLNPLEYGYLMGDWNLPERTRRGNFRHDMNPDVRFDAGNVLFAFARTPGVSVAHAAGLDEVVVVGYSSSMRRSLQGSVAGVHIRGITSLTSYNQPLIILDGVPFEGDLSKIDPATITAGLVLKGADASAIYGSRAAGGVLVLSTKGEIIFPEPVPEPPLPPRKNFNETAFFFPAIHAGRDGYYSFSFTMPESVTEWNWKMLAHTKAARFAYAERKLNTQLPLMVQPNMPRLLYQGDRIVLQSRISNLDSMDASGKISCRIEDAVTGEDISGKLLTQTQRDFSVAKASNSTSSFEINIPIGQMNPVKLVVTVRSADFADGEEHILPVLNPKLFVRQSQPVYFTGTDTTITPHQLPADAELYGIGLSVQPKPQSALINSLPYLANFSFDCAEQITNKILALTTAISILRTDSLAQQSFERARTFVEKNENTTGPLPDDIAETAMPWLNLSSQTKQQQEQLFRLFDSSQSYAAISNHLDKLYRLQNSDGGLSWFSGGQSNLYISQYVSGVFGKMKADGLLLRQNIFESRFNSFITKLLAYCEKHFLSAQKAYWYEPLEFIRARRYWINEHPVADEIKTAMDSVILQEWKEIHKKPLHRQALLIILVLQSNAAGTEMYREAISLLSSIRQQAIEDEVNGIRWKAIADADDLNRSAEETVVLLAEAFGQTGKNNDVVKGIIQWLLTAKNDHHWGSTKATAAVAGLLKQSTASVTGTSQEITAIFNDSLVSVSNDLLSGALFTFREVRKRPQMIQLQQKQPGQSAGSLGWYYFTSTAATQANNDGIVIKKILHRYNESIKKWEAVNEGMMLKIADVIRVTLTIESSKALQYVYIDDKRAAAFEPINNSSGYDYTGFGYYRSVRDAGIQFFADFIPSGRHEISYEVKVAHEGEYFNGPASLKCMYRPEINAYSDSFKFRIAN